MLNKFPYLYFSFNKRSIKEIFLHNTSPIFNTKHSFRHKTIAKSIISTNQCVNITEKYSPPTVEFLPEINKLEVSFCIVLFDL